MHCRVNEHNSEIKCICWFNCWIQTQCSWQYEIKAYILPSPFSSFYICRWPRSWFIADTNLYGLPDIQTVWCKSRLPWSVAPTAASDLTLKACSNRLRKPLYSEITYNVEIRCCILNHHTQKERKKNPLNALKYHHRSCEKCFKQKWHISVKSTVIYWYDVISTTGEVWGSWKWGL